MNAKQSLSSISANQELWVEQFRQEMFERDYRLGLSAAKSEGRTEAKLETARNMLKKELLTLDDISEYTGLPLETVQQLAEELHDVSSK